MPKGQTHSKEAYTLSKEPSPLTEELRLSEIDYITISEYRQGSFGAM